MLASVVSFTGKHVINISYHYTNKYDTIVKIYNKKKAQLSPTNPRNASLQVSRSLSENCEASIK